MKAYLFFLATLCYTICFSQDKDTVHVNSTLNKATVYYGFGAELQHVSRASLSNGHQQVVISGMAVNPDINTFQIACPENVTILSYYHRIYKKEQIIIKPEVKQNDTLKMLQNKLAGVNNQININEDILRRITLLIETNFVTPVKKEISAAELIKLTEYYSTRVKTIKEKIFELQFENAELNAKIKALNERIYNPLIPPTLNKEKPTGQLVMQVVSKGAITADLEISYFTRNAGWIPSYDIRVKSIDNSLKLSYKAQITQSTGIDWKNTKLSLSTSNPVQGTALPILSTSYLQLYVPVLYDKMKTKKEGYLNAPSARTEEISSTDVEFNRAEDKDNVEAYTTLQESQLNINFNIDLPYDIPSDGKPYLVSIKDESLSALYKHFAIPKMDKDVFLTARLTRWDSLGLLPGEANIIMDNVYLGKSFIDPNATADTLALSLGRDKRIAINRKLVKDLTTSKDRSDFKLETYTYEITIKNNKKQVASIEIQDQFPISKIKDVEIKVTSPDAESNSETGLLTWNITLQPGESKKIRFSYTVKYPKEMVVRSGY